MSLSIQQSTEFSPATVQFSKLRKNKNGGKAVYLNAGDNKKLYIQFPFMRSPYGLSAFTDEGTGRTSYSLDLSFDTDNEEAMALHNKLKELDDIIVNTVAENSKEWLGKEFNVAVLKEALYKPMIRPGKEQYPSTIKLKILTKPDGAFVPEAYSMQKQPVSLDTVEKGQRFGSSITSSVWRSAFSRFFLSSLPSSPLSPSRVLTSPMRRLMLKFPSPNGLVPTLLVKLKITS